MNRDRVSRWLRSGHRTWRWLPDPENADRYLAIESTDEGFRFFAWSHVPGEDGLTREERQSFDSFERDGPAWPAPSEIEIRIREWLAKRQAPDA